jgi:hypothetical protein
MSAPFVNGGNRAIGARRDHGGTIKPKSHMDDLERTAAMRAKISLVPPEAHQGSLTEHRIFGLSANRHRTKCHATLGRSEQIAQNFRCLTTFSVLRFSKIHGALGRTGRGVQLRTVAMVDLILVLSIFAAGGWCGFYLRDRISKKRRELYLASRRARRSRRDPPTIGQILHH